jgi:hypothetical protein
VLAGFQMSSYKYSEIKESCDKANDVLGVPLPCNRFTILLLQAKFINIFALFYL